MPISVNEQTCSSAGASEYTNMQRRYLGVKWSQVQNTVSPTQVRVYFLAVLNADFRRCTPMQYPNQVSATVAWQTTAVEHVMRYNLVQVAHADEA
jgi:hypothetical protein